VRGFRIEGAWHGLHCALWMRSKQAHYSRKARQRQKRWRALGKGSGGPARRRGCAGQRAAPARRRRRQKNGGPVAL